MHAKTDSILKTLNILTWIVFIGLLIQAGAILVSFFVSLFVEGAAKNVYLGLNLYELQQASQLHYSFVIFFMLVPLILKVYAAHFLIQVFTKIKLASPFTSTIAGLIEKTSYIVLAVWATGVLGTFHLRWLSETGQFIIDSGISGETLFLAGIIFVIAQVFKKGVEIQSEHELTV